MYVHEKCAPSGAEIVEESRTAGFCDACDQEGTIYHVKGTEDYYEKIVAGVRLRVVEGVEYSTRAAVRARFRELDYLAKAVRSMDAWNETHPAWEYEADHLKFVAEYASDEELPEIELPKDHKILDASGVKDPLEEEPESIPEIEAETVVVEEEEEAPAPEPEEPAEEEVVADEPVRDDIEEAEAEPEEEEEPAEKTLEDMSEEELRARLRELEEK